MIRMLKMLGSTGDFLFLLRSGQELLIGGWLRTDCLFSLSSPYLYFYLYLCLYLYLYLEADCFASLSSPGKNYKSNNAIKEAHLYLCFEQICEKQWNSVESWQSFMFPPFVRLLHLAFHPQTCQHVSHIVTKGRSILLLLLLLHLIVRLIVFHLVHLHLHYKYNTPLIPKLNIPNLQYSKRTRTKNVSTTRHISRYSQFEELVFRSPLKVLAGLVGAGRRCYRLMSAPVNESPEKT